MDDTNGQRTDRGCTHQCVGPTNSAWGTCITAAAAIGAALLAMLGHHDRAGLDRPFHITIAAGPNPTLHHMPRDMLGHDIRPQPWATGRAILAAAITATPIRTGPADRAGPAREHLRITARRDISGTAHLYRTGILTTGHHRRISIDGIAGGTLCLNGGAAQPGPTSELDCTDCYDAADRPMDANGWIIGNTLVQGDHVGLAVLAALADPAAHPST